MATGINEGTQTFFQTDTVGTQIVPYWKLDVGAAGASSPFTNTLGTVQNLNKGTITKLEAGTVALNMVPVTAGTSFVVVGTAGSGFWGTIIAAAGAGTKQYVSGIDVIGVSGTVEVAITNIGVTGSTGAGVLARGFIPPTGGISKNFNPIQVSATNGTLAYWLGGAGTVDITIQYWQGV